LWYRGGAALRASRFTLAIGEPRRCRFILQLLNAVLWCQR
jgi:hypothetical protein